MLTNHQLNKITQEQKAMQRRFRSVPAVGKYVKYLGKKFIIHKNVFWPFADSEPLVKNYQIHPGEEVLDVGTGSGVIAIFAAYQGAKRVVALDINPAAIKTTEANVKLHGFEKIIEVKQSDIFVTLQEGEKFDVITVNLPLRDLPAADIVEASQWDTNFSAHKKFFAGASKYLRRNGRIYLSQANFGAVDKMKSLAKKSGFSIKLIGQKNMPSDDQRIFYAFELTIQ